jgi:hypothetical protein
MEEQQVVLGLLPEEGRVVSPSVTGRLELIEQMDLTVEKRSFVARHPEEREHLELLERELKRFLSLPLLVPDPDFHFAPSVRVDELWHDQILNTAKYRRFCNLVYGEYLDHQPNQEELSEEFSHLAGEIAEYTNSLLVRYFGSLEHTIWGDEIMRPCYPPPASVGDTSDFGLRA